MNAISKTAVTTVAWKFSLPRISLANCLLYVILLFNIFSAFSVVYCRELTREMTGDMQNLQYQMDTMTLQHNQLLVEKTSLLTEERVVSLANARLNMVVPKPETVVMVSS